MHGQWWGLVLAAFVVPGCAHEAPVRPPIAEEPRVVAPETGKAKPIPEIDGNKPLAHEAEVNSMGPGICKQAGRGRAYGPCR